MKLKVNDEDSSSSEEENERLRSSVWTVPATEMMQNQGQDGLVMMASSSASGSTRTRCVAAGGGVIGGPGQEKGDDGRTTKKSNSHLQVIPKKPSVREQMMQGYEDQFSQDFRTVDVTPGVQNFVAKKLSGMLDRFVKTVTPQPQQPKEDVKESDEDDFKLLSTSCGPAEIKAPKSTTPKRRRLTAELRKRKKRKAEQYEDSSDSDVESRRFAEVSVSGLHILSSSAFAAPPSKTTEGATETNSSSEGDAEKSQDVDSKHSDHRNGMVEGADRGAVKRKKKRKRKRKEMNAVDASFCIENGQSADGQSLDVREPDVGKEGEECDVDEVKRKKKRKKQKADAAVVKGKDIVSSIGSDETLQSKFVNTDEEIGHSDNVKRKKKKKKRREDGKSTNITENGH